MNPHIKAIKLKTNKGYAISLVNDNADWDFYQNTPTAVLVFQEINIDTLVGIVNKYLQMYLDRGFSTIMVGVYPISIFDRLDVTVNKLSKGDGIIHRTGRKFLHMRCI